MLAEWSWALVCVAAGAFLGELGVAVGADFTFQWLWNERTLWNLFCFFRSSSRRTR